MLKYLNPSVFIICLGKIFLEFFPFCLFSLVFYSPLLNTLMLAFADTYQVPHVFPTKFGFEWWKYIFSQDDLLQSIVNSFVIAVLATAISLVICTPAAYALARFEFKGRSFLLVFPFFALECVPRKIWGCIRL